MASIHERESRGARPIKIIFTVAGHLFIFLALLLISTLAGVPLSSGIGLVLLGYLNVLCVVQAVLHTLRRGLTLPRLLLAFAYSIGGLVQSCSSCAFTPSLSISPQIPKRAPRTAPCPFSLP